MAAHVVEAEWHAVLAGSRSAPDSQSLVIWMCRICKGLYKVVHTILYEYTCKFTCMMCTGMYCTSTCICWRHYYENTSISVDGRLNRH